MTIAPANAQNGTSPSLVSVGSETATGIGTGETGTKTGTEIVTEIARGTAIGIEIEETGTGTEIEKAGGIGTKQEGKRTGTGRTESGQLLPVVRDGMIVGLVHRAIEMEVQGVPDGAGALPGRRGLSPMGRRRSQ